MNRVTLLALQPSGQRFLPSHPLGPPFACPTVADFRGRRTLPAQPGPALRNLWPRLRASVSCQLELGSWPPHPPWRTTRGLLRGARSTPVYLIPENVSDGRVSVKILS